MQQFKKDNQDKKVIPVFGAVVKKLQPDVFDN
jgi:hypothetical protein